MEEHQPTTLTVCPGLTKSLTPLLTNTPQSSPSSLDFLFWNSQLQCLVVCSYHREVHDTSQLGCHVFCQLRE